jgi:hypothetical protein
LMRSGSLTLSACHRLVDGSASHVMGIFVRSPMLYIELTQMLDL